MYLIFITYIFKILLEQYHELKIKQIQIEDVILIQISAEIIKLKYGI